MGLPFRGVLTKIIVGVVVQCSVENLEMMMASVERVETRVERVEASVENSRERSTLEEKKRNR